MDVSFIRYGTRKTCRNFETQLKTLARQTLIKRVFSSTRDSFYSSVFAVKWICHYKETKF